MTPTPMLIETRTAPDVSGLVAGIHHEPLALQAHFDGQVVTAEDLRQLESELGRRLYEHRHVGRDQTRPVTLTRRDQMAEDVIRAGFAEGSVHLPVTGHRALADGTYSATLLGARVRLPDTAPLVELSDVWPAISPGFLMVLGPDRPRALPGRAPWRLYLAGSDLTSAAATFAVVIKYLRCSARRWQAKVTSVPGEYPRTDAVTVYVDADEGGVLPGLVRQVHEQAAPSWERSSAFTLRLAPGTGLAQEPQDPDPRRQDLSLGQHRAAIVAGHVINPQHADIHEALSAAGVDPHNPWRNLPA